MNARRKLSEPEMPEVLAQIAAAAGEEVALKLADAIGGTEIWLPRRISDDDHWLAQAVGREAADAICAHFLMTNADDREVGSLRLLIPRFAARGRFKLWRKVVEMTYSGFSTSYIAKKLKISERTVYRIRRAMGVHVRPRAKL